MTGFWIGAGVATYFLVTAYFIADGWRSLRWWERLAVFFWPIVVVVFPTWRWIKRRIER
jgi:hypothetical protein